MIQICQKNKDKVYKTIRTRKVDTYLPAKENMIIYQDAVTLAVASGK